MRVFLLFLIAFACPSKAATYLSYTSPVVETAITNWAGATDVNRPMLISVGDSIAADYWEPPGAIVYPTPQLTGILLNHPDWRQTNGAVGGWYTYQIFPEATNLVWTRKPLILHVGSPANDAVSFVNFPTTMWETLLPTNDLLAAVCRSNGTKMVLVGFIPRTSDYEPIQIDWDAKATIWAGRSTNSDVVTFVPLAPFFRDPLNTAQMKSEYTSDLLHNTPWGGTNYCLVLSTGIVNSILAGRIQGFASPPVRNFRLGR